MKNQLSCLVILSVMALFVGCKDKGDDPQLDTLPIELSCDAFKTDMTLTDNPDRPVDYYIPCVMDVEANIVVNPGVVIEFGDEAGINVTNTGSFSAVGTSSANISMMGGRKAKGVWKGILFNSSSSNNRLHYVNIAHAGSSTFNTNNDIASVIIWADTKLDIQNCNINNGGKYGLSAIYTNSNWSIRNSQITACNDAPAIFLAPYLAALDGSNDFQGNAKNFLMIDLATQFITSSLTWKKANVPYRITPTYAFFNELTIDNGTVTIEPGTQIYFEPGTGLWVDENAALVAVGTATDSITFTGVNPVAGSWSAIYFDGNTTTNSQLKFVKIQYAGATLDFEKSGVLMRIDPTLSITDATFRDIGGCSIYNKSSNLNPNLTSADLIHINTTGTLCSD